MTIRRHVLAAAAVSLALVAAPAFAFHCPKDMAKIDAALAAHPKLSAQKLAQVEAWRAQGEAYHKAGKHQEAVDTLAKALAALGIQ